ncbi:MAG: glycosyltransferase family 2 protein [Candidatus Sumerlaeia bacterium]
MKLSIIIPVYNERRTIETVIEKVRNQDIGPLEREIIIVDGNSIDGTRDLLKRFENLPEFHVIFEREPRGRGRAIKEGLDAATGDIVIFQDADLELDPADYPALLKPILDGRAEVVFGSRFLRERPPMRFLQYWGNKVINWAVNLLYGTHLTDVETCYQVFRREAIRGLKLHSDQFAFTVELTVKLLKRGYQIVEIPVHYVPRGRLEGKKIYWADGFASLWVLVKYRFFG